MVLGIQIVGFLFGLFIMYLTFLNYKRKEFTTKEFIFWIILWVIFVALTLFPFLLDHIVKSFGFFRALDVLIVSGFLFLITAVFYTYTVVRRTQRQIEKVVREIAINKSKKK